jgi:hypothetical protein
LICGRAVSERENSRTVATADTSHPADINVTAAFLSCDSDTETSATVSDAKDPHKTTADMTQKIISRFIKITSLPLRP